MIGIDAATCPASRRDECELRYVLGLATKAERADYLDRAERFDGKASTDSLRMRVAEGWAAARAAGTPVPCRCDVAPGAAAAVHHAVNRPGNGSSLDHPHAGNSDPEGGVVSGAAA
jgi:hypothetical protein